MPMIQYDKLFSIFGFRKIWDTDNGEAFKYDRFYKDGISGNNYVGLVLQSNPFILQVCNCIIICYVFLQVAIYDSPGYQKFIRTKDGKLNMLLQLSVSKG
jgi:hypothetical protein